MVEEEENTQERKEGNQENPGNPGNLGEDVKLYINIKNAVFFYLYNL